MIDRSIARGLFLALIALAFGLNAFRYDIGSLDQAGPGLFPLMISAVLLLIAVLTLVKARFSEFQALSFNVRNIAILLTALIAFAALSRFVNMTVAIVAMVFIASLAASTRSWKGNVQVAAGLVVIAFAFQKLLSLNLPLY